MSDAAKRLRGEREAVARGRLTFDRDEAREKMRKFRLADPHFYVLQFVRAASVLGARRIEFELGTRSMVCTFDRALPTEKFDDFWGAVFESRTTAREQALHNVALGVGSAQALKPREIRVSSGRRTIVFTDDGEEIFDSEGTSGTRIELTEKFRFGHLFEFITGHAEADALQHYCRYAQILVFVNGESIQSAEGHLRTDFKSQTESGFVALRRDDASTRTMFYFLRDDVLVRTHNVPAQMQPALGAVNSKLLKTDLSGLELAKDEALDRLLYVTLYDAYHASLLRWASQASLRPVLMRLGQTVVGHMKRLRRMGYDVPRSTHALFEWWMQQKIFVPADPGALPVLSTADAMHDGAIVYSHHSVTGTKHTRYPEVIFISSAEERELIKDLHDAGIATRDVTDEMTRAEEAFRNRRLWETQPQRETPFTPVIRTVDAGEGLGALFVPFSPRGDVGEGEFTTYSQGRRLTRRSLRLPIRVFVDGPLTIEPSYRDVVRDQRFRQLAEKLVGQTGYFVRDVIEHALEPPANPLQIEIGLKLLASYLSGELFEMLADAFLLDVERLAAEPLDIIREVNRLKLLDRLGRIADARLFETVSGSWRSLRDIYLKREPPVVLGPRMLAVAVTSKRVEALGYDVFSPSPAAAQILRHIRPDCRSETFALEVANEARFMERPQFRPADAQVLQSTSQEHSVAEGSYRIDVELLGEGQHCDVSILYRDRLLTTRSWPTVVGRFRATVRSEDLTPNTGFNDVVETLLFDQIYQSISAQVRHTLSAWCLSVREEEELPPSKFRLLWAASMAWADAQPGALTIPVWRSTDDAWTRSVVSRDELSEVVARDGGVLRVHRGAQAPPNSLDGVIVRAPPDGELATWLSGRVVEVGDAVDSAAREAFMSRPVVTRPAVAANWVELGALFAWSGEIDGFNVDVAMLPDPDLAPFGHKNVIAALWEERHLEEIPEWVPFGRFHTYVRGPQISPDPDFAFVGSGRGAAIRAAQNGVVEMLREACARFDGQRSSPKLERARTELLMMFAACQRSEPAPPFDLFELFSKTPLYLTADGELLAFDELADRAFEGVIPYVTAPNLSSSLLVDTEQVALTEETLGSNYGLMLFDDWVRLVDEHALDTLHPLADDAYRSDPQSQPVVRLHEDEVLDRLMRLLESLRGDDDVPLPSNLLTAVRWDDEISGLGEVDLAGIRVRSQHPLVQLCREDPADATRLRFLASVVCSLANSSLRVFTDAQDLELQATLIADS